MKYPNSDHIKHQRRSVKRRCKSKLQRVPPPKKKRRYQCKVDEFFKETIDGPPKEEEDPGTSPRTHTKSIIMTPMSPSKRRLIRHRKKRRTPEQALVRPPVRAHTQARKTLSLSLFKRLLMGLPKKRMMKYRPSSRPLHGVPPTISMGQRASIHISKARILSTLKRLIEQSEDVMDLQPIIESKSRLCKPRLRADRYAVVAFLRRYRHPHGGFMHSGRKSKCHHTLFLSNLLLQSHRLAFNLIFFQRGLTYQ